MRHRYLLIVVTILTVIGLTAVLAVTWSRHTREAVAPARTPAPSAPSPSGGTAPATTRPTGTGSADRSPPGPAATATTFPVPASLRGKDVTAIPTDRRVVALTFDAGANAAGLPAILSTLATARVPATFFLTGAFATGNPAGVRAIATAGHRIGNHSTTHPYFTGLTDDAIRTELTRAETAIRAAGGGDPHPLFRFPYGARDTRTIAAVNSAGYACVRWTVDTLGWKGTSGGVTAESIVDRVLAAARPGGIVLMHIGSNPDDHSTLDADALPEVIDRLRGTGYGFVTLDALL